jgi:uncharacterized protein involved in tellurium resistance
MKKNKALSFTFDKRKFMYHKNESITRGNPMVGMRFRWQTWTVKDDSPLESEWSQTKSIAIYEAEKHLLFIYNQFGENDVVVKIFNEMNHNQPPVIVTLEQAMNRKKMITDARLAGCARDMYEVLNLEEKLFSGESFTYKGFAYKLNINGESAKALLNHLRKEVLSKANPQ